MFIKEIKISNFRNLKSLELLSNGDFNLIVGKNAQGKSNLLEALYSLGLGRSYRTNREEDTIKFQESNAFVTGKFQHGQNEFSLAVAWDRKNRRSITKSIRYNGNPIQKLSEFIEKAPMILFTTDDLEIIRGEPVNRRKYIDLLTSRIYSTHISNLRSYRKILEGRNKWFKLPHSNRDRHLGEIYRQKLISIGSEIILRRLEVMEIIKPIIDRLYSSIFGGETPEIRYRTTVKNIRKKTIEDMQEAFTGTLDNLRSNEFYRKFTLAGPHRDDFDLRLRGKSMRSFASMGEIRSMSVILKLAGVELISEKTGLEPIVLIDDCLNEFDREHIEKFLDFLMGKRQIFYATTELHSYFKKIQDISFFIMEKGEIKPCSQSALEKL
ncbi:MAG: DNA replication and repair protein RecF [Candidatus Eremiobacteraeota bacterium]|nr:DNA replication and repair protein RecF [Candidatus Eremiobacteraeota bacterium]